MLDGGFFGQQVPEGVDRIKGCIKLVLELEMRHIALDQASFQGLFFKTRFTVFDRRII